MIAVFKPIYDYRELLQVLTWKNIALRYKQSHLGLAWMVLRPLVMVAIFVAVRSFVGIDSGDVPYALLTYCAMVPWMFFQEAASDGVGSVVNHATLVKKIYFPREIFPMASVVAACVQLLVGLGLLSLLMAVYRWAPTWQVLWVPVLLLCAILAALTIALAGAAVNVYSRDAGQGIPLLLGMAMYLTPVIYPLDLVRKALVEREAAGSLSATLWNLYLLNPMTGVIDGFQNVILRGLPPNWSIMTPGMSLVAVLLPLSYLFFKRAEAYFADVI